MKSDDISISSDVAVTRAELGLRESEAAFGGLRALEDIDAFSAKADTFLIEMMALLISIVILGFFVLREIFSKITDMARFDGLTDLLKRAPMLERLSAALHPRERQRDVVALMSLDLDRFKAVNDAFGHPVGDQLLVEAAGRIKAALGSDQSAARFGGDEFILLLTGLADESEAGRMAARIVEALSAPFLIERHRIYVGVSVGIAISRGNDDAEGLLRKSDIALYRAKAEGKGCWRYFTDEMGAALLKRRTMEIELRAAIENDLLVVHYHPLIDLKTGRITGCEALVRWLHPTRGYISPTEFIPVAEETGLIAALGRRVLRTACREAALWAGHLRIAVNVSAAQFELDDVVTAVREALAEAKLPAHRLELEITESAFIAASREVLDALNALRAMGVTLAMDDFGTGYSSLSYLSTLPFNTIKIDRSFVRNVAQRAEVAAIVRAITTLARSLGMTTTAEGVERIDELDWLRANGCDEVQGFLFGRPTDAESVRKRLVEDAVAAHSDIVAKPPRIAVRLAVSN